MDTRRRAAWIAAGAIGAIALIHPALINGFPLIFYDTAGYFERGLDWNLSPGRSLVYGLFTAVALPLGWGFWPVIAAQALLVVWLLHLAARCLECPSGPAATAAYAAVLAATTGIAWYAGQIMPDILAPVVVLGLYLLAFRGDRLGQAERWAVGLAVAFGIASHMSHLALATGLLICIALAAATLRRGPPGVRPRVRPAAAAVLLGILAVPAANGALAGHWGFTPGGQTFVFARLVHDGIVARFLADRCPSPEYRLCDFRDRMPATADDWVWSGDSPFHQIGGWEGGAEEMRRIAAESLRDYPWLHIAEAAGSVVEQFLFVRTGDGIDPEMWVVAGTIGDRLPDLLPAYLAARQQTGELGFAGINRLHVPVAYLSLGLAAAILGWSLWRGPADQAAFVLFVLVALLGNAAICGLMSNPHDRYQSRVVWLATVCVLLALGRALAHWRARTQNAAIADPPRPG